MIFVDDAFRKVWAYAYAVKHKVEVLKIFKHFHIKIEGKAERFYSASMLIMMENIEIHFKNIIMTI